MNVLTDKTYKTYTRLSRYNNFPYYYQTLDNKYIYGITANLRNDTPYIIHTVVQNDTFDSLALKYYNNPTYFWVISDYNRYNDPYERPAIGTQLKIPSFSDIVFNS
jgi:hypothetical protein